MPDDERSRPHAGQAEQHEIAVTPLDIRQDLELEREALDESIRHDYSTSDTGLVPLDRRRPLWHFAGLWLTFGSGFSFLFLGFVLHDGGYRLISTAGIILLGILIYLAYATVAAYLGSRTGQTHSLLTRSIFGVTGSWLVSAFLIIGPIGWVGFQGNLTAQIWDGLYGWGHILLIGVIVSVLMVANNVLGFTGVSAYARYIVTPLMVLWIMYLVIKGFTEGSDFLGATPETDSPMSFWLALGAVVGFSIWGNEPDLFRFGKPRFWWPVPAYVFGFVFGLLLFGVGGWMMAQLAGTEFGPSLKATTEYSLFGAFWLAFILSLLGQVAINDGNYYEAINSGQNLLGGWKRWRRVYTCLVMAGFGGLAAWIVPYELTNGFLKLAAFQAITLPCATIIMATDHFVVPRLFGISRDLTKVPAWRNTRPINWPAVAALVIAVLFGAIGSGIMPGLDASRYWYLIIPETWVLSALLYIAGVALTRSVSRDVSRDLGFARGITSDFRTAVPLDIATAAEAGASTGILSAPAGAHGAGR
jgi:purine-cytosine permease-like protein